MSGPAAAFLLRAPFLYPVAGLVALLAHPAVGARAIYFSLLELVVPIYWVSHRLCERHHTAIFAAVFDERAGRPSAAASGPHPAPTPDQAARLDAVEAVSKAAATPADAHGALLHPPSAPLVGPLVAAALFVIRPPPTAAGWAVSAARRAIAAPIGLAFPALPRLLSVLSTGDVGTAWLAPFLKAAGKAAARGSRGGVAGAAALTHAGPLGATAFGAAALALGCVPVLSRVLAFPVAAGAALWAADLAAAAG